MMEKWNFGVFEVKMTHIPLPGSNIFHIKCVNEVKQRKKALKGTKLSKN